MRQFLQFGIKLVAFVAVVLLGFETEGVGRVEGNDLGDLVLVVAGHHFRIERLQAFMNRFSLVQSGGGFRFLETGIAGFADLAQFGQVFVEGFRPPGQVAGFGVGPAFGIGQQDGGETLDGVGFLEFFILLLQFLGQFGLLREVQLQQDEVFGGLLFESVLGEDFLLQLDAPAAPVGTGEIHQNILVVLGGGSLGFFKVGAPALRGAHGRGKSEDQGGHGRRKGTPGGGGKRHNLKVDGRLRGSGRSDAFV